MFVDTSLIRFSATECFLDNIGIGGNSYPGSGKFGVQDYLTCQKSCQLDPQCQGFSYLFSRKWCGKKLSLTNLNEGTGDLIISGPKMCPCFKWNKTQVGTEMVPMLEHVATDHECQERCQYTEGCTAFSYELTTGYCHLYSEELNVVDKEGFISGPVLC